MRDAAAGLNRRTQKQGSSVLVAGDVLSCCNPIKTDGRFRDVHRLSRYCVRMFTSAAQSYCTA